MEVWEEKLINWIVQNQRLPWMFETYNCYEVGDIFPTLTTRVNTMGGSSNVLILEKKDE